VNFAIEIGIKSFSGEADMNDKWLRETLIGTGAMLKKGDRNRWVLLKYP
jgi:hypothetical protein